MLRACGLGFKSSWDEQSPLAEFFNNNSYHYSIQMAPFEALYERSCRYPINIEVRNGEGRYIKKSRS